MPDLFMGVREMRISLNGNDWLFKGYLGEDWFWRNGEKPGTRDVRWWNKGTVPGSVHNDLWQLGEIPDPYYERNSLLVEWVHQRTWIYKKSFAADPAWRGQTVALRFEGVDYSAQFFLNGKPLGAHRGMYTPVSFDITDLVSYDGENLVAVVIDRAPDEEPQVSKTSYVDTHKSRMTYWWDFCPRMPHIGIWDDVYLEVTGPVQVSDLWVRPVLNDDYSRADLSVSVALQSSTRETVELETTITLDGQVVATTQTKHALPPGETRLNLLMPVDQPKLWWPNGHGEQPLYEARVAVLSEGAHEYHARQISFGIRRIEMAGNDTPDPTALNYVLVVNGKRIYIKGWNWVPIDVMYGVERPEKLNRLLTMARQANVNLLRIWGGGLIEKEAFYNLCDRYGIMVWQEFIMSSSGIANKPSTDPGFIDMMVKEAEQIIPRKRNHPSLVLWCGGNELAGLDEKPLTDAEPVLAALKDAVNRLDPDRFWLATSPTGRVFGNTLENIKNDPDGLHDVHGPWEHQGLTGQYTLYNNGTSLLHSEFGAEGMAFLNTLNATISTARQWPTNRDNPVYFHRGSWWINEPLVQEIFAGIDNVATLSRASQFLQAEALRYALESNRRRQWRNSGSILWQFNEPYPNSWCTAAVDYYAQPKAAYYAVARAYAPVSVSAKFETQAWEGREYFQADLWAANSHVGPIGGARLSVRIVGASGKVLLKEQHTVDVAANGAGQIGRVTLPLAKIGEELFFLDLGIADSTGALVAENRYLFTTGKTLKPMLGAPATALEVVRTNDGLRITNTGAYTALQVGLEDPRELLSRTGYLFVTDNYFSLLPGESRTVRADWTGAPEGERQVAISGWNTGATIHA